MEYRQPQWEVFRQGQAKRHQAEIMFTANDNIDGIPVLTVLGRRVVLWLAHLLS